jgi:excisionase family DNA binding protein
LYILRQTFLVRCPEKSTERSVVADYLKLPEVARRLDVSEKTARRMVKSGSLPAVFIGGAYRISEEDLAAYLQSAKVEPGKAPAPPSQRSLFNGEERRSKLEEAERAVQYITGRAEWYEQELEHERLLEYKTADRAYILAVLAIEEFSSLHRWFFDVVARDLVREIENGNAPELVDEFDSLEETFIERISRTQRMLLDNAKGLAEIQDQRDALARLRKTGDSNTKIRRHSA